MASNITKENHFQKNQKNLKHFIQKTIKKYHDRKIVQKRGLPNAKQFLNFPQDWRESESESESQDDSEEVC